MQRKFLMAIVSANPVKTQIIRKWSSLIADMETVLVELIEYQTSDNIIQNKVLTLSII